jgi:hypothetical protein
MCRATALAASLGLHGLEQVTVEDRLMLPKIQLAPIDDLADVEPVLSR